MKDGPQDEWLDTIAVDKIIRNQPKKGGVQFAHSSRIPLDEVDLSTTEERGQYSFSDECDGMCGV